MENTDMVSSCFALNCTERYDSGTLYTFHCIPNNQERAQEWLKALGREDVAINKHTKVCSRHFAPECFVFGKITSLTPDAVPSLHLGTPLESDIKESKKRKRGEKPYFFSEYTEEDIKNSPLDALRAFRVAKLSIWHKTQQLEALRSSKTVLEKRLFEFENMFNRIPKRLRQELELNPFSEVEVNENFSPLLKTLLTQTEIETDLVNVKEEPLSDSNKDPCLQDSHWSPEVELLDQDDWVKAFPRDKPSPQPADDEILGLPVLGLPMSLDESDNLPIDAQSTSIISILGLPTSSDKSTDLPTDVPSTSAFLGLSTSSSAKSADLPTDLQSTSTIFGLPASSDKSADLPTDLQSTSTIFGLPASSAKSADLPTDLQSTSTIFGLPTSSAKSADLPTDVPSTSIASPVNVVPSYLQDSSGTILHRCDADQSIATSSTDSSTSIATQTPYHELIGIATEVQRSVATQTRPKRRPTIEELEKRPFDGFGRFVAERMNQIDINKAMILQMRFGNLMYLVESGEPLSHIDDGHWRWGPSNIGGTKR